MYMRYCYVWLVREINFFTHTLVIDRLRKISSRFFLCNYTLRWWTKSKHYTFATYIHILPLFVHNVNARARKCRLVFLFEQYSKLPMILIHRSSGIRCWPFVWCMIRPATRYGSDQVFRLETIAAAIHGVPHGSSRAVQSSAPGCIIYMYFIILWT